MAGTWPVRVDDDHGRWQGFKVFNLVMVTCTILHFRRLMLANFHVPFVSLEKVFSLICLRGGIETGSFEPLSFVLNIFSTFAWRDGATMRPAWLSYSPYSLTEPLHWVAWRLAWHFIGVIGLIMVGMLREGTIWHCKLIKWSAWANTLPCIDNLLQGKISLFEVRFSCL